MNLLNIQKEIENFTKDKKLNSNVGVRLIDLASEVGELAKEVLKGTEYGKKAFEPTENWKSEIGDVFFSLICIANETHTDLGECLKHVLDKYEKRFSIKGSLDSGK